MSPTPAPRQNPARALWLVVPATAIVLGVGYIGTLSYALATAPSAAAPSAAAPVTSPPATSGTGSPGPAPEPSGTPSGSAAPYGPVKGLRGGRECSRDGSGPWSAVAVNETTSCAFAENVRQAYQLSGLDGSAGTIEAWSPTTGQGYVLSCQGNQPAVCTGGRNAKIQIYGGVYVPKA